jgi:hypothetical protein
MTAALPMGGQKITGMADPTLIQDAATKNYVDTTTAAFFSTGDVKITLKIVADSGWVMADDGTIGSASSGASTRANADTQALFTLLFNSIVDVYSPIFTSGGGATTRAAQVSAAAAWAANCRISLTKVLGRALGVSGAGSGLTNRSIGQVSGSETNIIAQNMLPNVTVAANTSGTVTVYTTVTNVITGTAASFLLQNGSTGLNAIANGSISGNQLTSTGFNALSGATASLNGGVTQAAIGIVSPVSYFNCMVKL